jgi:hypothetical protein
MKNFLFVLLGLVMHPALQAQLHSDFDSSIRIFKSKINHNSIKNNVQKFITVEQSTQQLNDNSVVQLPPPVLMFKYNVNNFDIYQATPDDIYLVKPDDTILFNMPVADLRD